MKEPETIAWLSGNVRQGDIVYDIGANVGAYSLIAASLAGDSGQVLAFEPSAENFVLLCRNIHRNGMSHRVQAVSIALDGSSRIATFTYATMEAGGAGNSVASDDVAAAMPLRHVLTTMTLDEAVFKLGLPCPNHIKIDVDGQEAAIVSGGARLLADPRVRTVQVEVELHRQGAASIQERMLSAGFILGQRTKHEGPQGVENHLYIRSGQ